MNHHHKKLFKFIISILVTIKIYFKLKLIINYETYSFKYKCTEPGKWISITDNSIVSSKEKCNNIEIDIEYSEISNDYVNIKTDYFSKGINLERLNWIDDIQIKGEFFWNLNEINITQNKIPYFGIGIITITIVIDFENRLSVWDELLMTD